MKLKTVVELLNGKSINSAYSDETEVFAACGCDLMSDVLAYVKDQALLLTGLVNPQVVRTAEMMDMKAIVFVRGKTPGDEIISLANDAGIGIITTDYPLYIACGKLYSNGLYK